MAVACWCILWNLSIRDTACCSHYIELCTKLPLNESHLSIENRQLGPNGVHCREVSHSYCKVLHNFFMLLGCN